MRFRYVLLLFGASASFLLHAMDRFDHRSAFTCDAMRKAYQEVSSITDDELIVKFQECSINNGSFDKVIDDTLREIVKNPVGRDTLQLVVARLYPFIKCANSLEQLLHAIPETEQVEGSLISNKAKAVILLCDALGIRDQDVFITFLNIDTYISKLKTDPVVFPSPDTSYRKGSLLEVFKDGIHKDERSKKFYLMNEINKWWDADVVKTVAGILPTLREGVFSLVCGLKTEYTYDTSTNHAEISLSASRPSISTRCITGPLLYDRIDGQNVNVCYELRDERISADSGLHHEIFHHLTIGLESSSFSSFSEIVQCLVSKGIDILYIVNLKYIYTDMNEFRNIIGVFIDKKGKVYFDPCSEAAYLCCAGKHIRGTHKSSMRGILYIPISFVKFLKDIRIQGFSVDESPSLKDCSNVSWR